MLRNVGYVPMCAPFNVVRCCLMQLEGKRPKLLLDGHPLEMPKAMVSLRVASAALHRPALERPGCQGAVGKVKVKSTS